MSIRQLIHGIKTTHSAFEQQITYAYTFHISEIAMSRGHLGQTPAKRGPAMQV